MAEDVLTRERILQLFRKLDDRMFAQGIKATLYVVGGAALALTINGERVTTDIDGRYENPLIDTLAMEVARDEGLDSHWLNHSVNAAFSYFKKDAEAVTVFNGKCLTIQAASPPYLLAMKLAARREKDIDDILLLIQELGLSSKDEVMQTVGRYFNADLSAASYQRQQIEEFLDLVIEEDRRG
jgi:hypothetical protein